MKKFLLLFFLIFSPMLFAQTSTEAFETESAGSTSFTDNGVTFNIISHTSTFNIVNYPATGWSGTVNDNQYIDNTNNVGPASSSFSIKTTSNLFKVNRFWVYVADQFNNQNTIGTLTITGKLSGVTKFTQTKTNNFAISLGTTNGYTLIDLTNLNGQNYSNIVIDELQLTLGGNYYYLGLDAFTWVKDSNIVTTDSQSFITTWEVPNDNGSIKLYTDTNKYKYNYNVSWENIDDSDKKSKPLPNFKGDCVISNLPKGKYRVMITGDFPYFNVAKDFEDPNAKQLLTVEQWGTQLWKSMHKTFQSASNLIHIGKDIPNLTQVTDMSRMFDFAISFNGDLSKWDVSKVTDMQYIFSGASSFNGDLSKWNVSSLKNMQSMFHAAVAFDGDLSQWNVSSATNMIQVFAYAMSFNRDLSRWNVSNVTDMQSMFLGASSFNRDLSKWNVSKVIGPYGMLSMLEYSGMSVNNYDATLKGWANLSTVPSNVTLGATGLKYCTANTERDKLIKEKGWKINGDIKLGSEYILKDKSVVYDGKAHKLELELPHSFRGTYEIVDSSNNVVSDAINAGIYTVRAISECDQSVLHTATLTITPAVLTVTATPQSKVYGAVDSKLDYTISGLVNNDKEIDVLSGSLSRVAGENVGSYAITLGSLAANNNYILSFTGANLTIAPAVLIVSATAQSKIYGAVDPSLSYAVFGLIEGDLLSGSLSRVAGEDVGVYAITQGTLIANSNYSLSFIGANLTIDKASLTVTANPQSKIYGAVDPKLDYAVSGLINNDKETTVLSGSLSRALGEDVGTYAITQGDLKATGNYSLSFIGADLVITPALLTVSPTTQSKVYGAADPALDYKVSGLVNNDKETAVLSGSLSRALGEDVGSYAITQGDLKANGNYSLSFIGADLVITPALLTVSATTQSKVYGAVEPKLDYTVSGLVNNDKETDVLSGSLSRALGEDVGSYAITQGDLKANGNYSLSFIGANLTITPAVLTVSTNPQSKVYGAVEPKLDYAVSGLVNNDKETAVLSGSLSRKVGEDVGTYAITQGMLIANSNYVLSFIGADLTITPAVLTVTATLQSKVYGAVDSKLDYTISGLVNNDKETAVLSGSLSRAVGEDVGSYAITQGDLKANGNYTLVFKGANLTIGKAPLTVTANAQSKVYGAVDPKLDYTVSGLVNNDKETDVLSGSLFRKVGEDVGTYAITQGTLIANSNYVLSFTGADLNITPAVLIVSATAQSKVYGVVDPKLGYTVSGLIEGDLLSGSLSRAVGEDVGTYAINQGDLKANGNYALSFAGANLTIDKASLTVTVNPQSKIYGAVDPSLNYTVSGLVNNDKETAVLSGSLSRVAGEDVGTYSITQGDLKASGNYTLDFKGASLEVTPAVLIVTVNTKSKVYGDADPSLNYTVSGLVNNDKETDVLSGSLSREVGENVDNYAITQGTLIANSNYSLSFIGANLTIGKAPLTVTANAQSKVYGAVDPKLDYTVLGLVNNDKETDVLSGSLFRKVGEDVGSYAITQSDLKANGNYTLVFKGANLTIGKAPLTVTANPQSKVYGAVNPKFDYTVSGLQFIDKETAVLSGSLSRAVGEDVGSYAITQGDLKANGNYILDFKGASLEITPAVLTVTANPQSKVYGAADPALDYTVSGLQFIDKETAVLSDSLSRAVGEDVGTYAITQGDLKASGNYTLDFKGASLEITPAVLTVTVNTKSKVYGAADPKLDYTISGLVNNDKEIDVLSGSLSRALGEGVGSYVITQGDLKANGNYTVDFIRANLTIEKAPIIGMVLKGGTYVYDTKEKSVLLSSTLPIGTKVTYKNNKQTEAGEYEVTALIEGDNYIPLLLKTKLIINKAPQHIEFNALSPVLYDNLLQLQLIANSSVDLPINYTYMNVGTTVAATVTSTGLVKVLHPGSVIITAHQDGNNNYEPAQSVSQILVIKSDKAEINSLIINGRDIGELSSNKLFMLRCDEIDKQVEVELVTSEGASVNIGNHFFIDTPKAGIYNREIVVKSHSGTITNRYILSIERPFNFEDIVIQKFDNTLLVNNNPLTNGGYRFVGYKWFKNGKLIGNEQVYSVGNHRDDLLDIDALYSLELTTDKGEIIHSCPAMIKYTHTNSIKLYPNPVVKNGVMEIALDYPESSLKNITGSVYSLTGQFLFKVSLENKISEVILPNTLVEGVYLMIIKIEGQNKVFRFMVKP